MHDNDPDWCWVLAVAALGLLLLAFVNGAIATPRIAQPVPNLANDNIGVPDYPRPRPNTGAAGIALQVDFTGEKKIRFFVTSETRKPNGAAEWKSPFQRKPTIRF